MISRNLARRLEQLEDHLMPAAVEPGPIFTIDFVSAPEPQDVDSIDSRKALHVVRSIEIQMRGNPKSRSAKRW